MARWKAFPAGARAMAIAGSILLALTGLPAAPLQGAETAEVSDAHKDCTRQSAGPPAEGATGALVAGLVTWIEAATDYDVALTRNKPPRVKFADRGEVISYEGASLTVQNNVKALYDSQTRTIYLIRPWNERSVSDESSLLHELVHDVQFQNRHWLCANAAEKQAYELQARWLIEQHRDVRFNWVEIAILSRCSGSVHP